MTTGQRRGTLLRRRVRVSELDESGDFENRLPLHGGWNCLKLIRCDPLWCVGSLQLESKVHDTSADQPSMPSESPVCKRMMVTSARAENQPHARPSIT